VSDPDSSTDPVRTSHWYRRGAVFVLLLIVFAGGAAAYVFRPMPVPASPLLEAQKGSVAAGGYLAKIGNCAACHTVPGQAAYAGGVKFKTQFGTLYSTNITPDRRHGIGKWTFGQFHKAMKHGLRPDGAHLYPAFPYTSFAKMTDADIASLYLYFRSIGAVAQENRPNQMSFPFGNRPLLYFWNRLFHDHDGFRPGRARSPQWNRGGYLVEAVAHCGACHTPRNVLGALDEAQALHGGIYVDQVARGAYRQWAAVDLTPGPHGLARWSKKEIIWLKVRTHTRSFMGR
jgi:mono/diheme cytochrome c family protein